MKIYSALQIGEYHLNHCEDYLFTGQIGADKLLCAVMDGCTMATDSYFVSTLVGKILRKITVEKGYKEMVVPPLDTDIDSYLKSIIASLFKELNIARSQLMLDDKELLTTLIILLIDKKLNQGIVLSIGDGLVSINGNIIEYDQDNKPDYLGFHLNEDFETWYSSQQQKIIFDAPNDISIATDGISMFAQIKPPVDHETITPISFLVNDRTNASNDEMLQLKLKTLEHIYGLKPTDDLAIIRLIM